MPSFFGTDGIRGPVATSPLLTPHFLHCFGIALTRWAQHHHTGTPRIIIGRDTRDSGTMIERALQTGISAAGGSAFSAGIIPTPGLQHLLTAHKEHYDYAIMISASHNPAPDNGLKLITHQGKLTRQQEADLSIFLEQASAPPTCPARPSVDALPAHHAISYLSRISTFFPAQLLSGMTIALDCAQGATYRLAPVLFQACGARVHVMGNTPSGTNINDACGSTHPTALQQFTTEMNADLGFAFDGDGDRVIAVTKDGTIATGDHILALLHTHPRFAQQRTVVGTVMTNFGLERWLAERGTTLLRTPVGDAHVLRAMKEHDAALGGEPSGHIIIAPYLPAADGIFTALFAAHTARLTNNLSLETFTQSPQVQLNVPIKEKQDLTHEPYARIIRAHTPAAKDGRSVVRYSGTEAVLRIMVEHHDAAQARAHATALATQLTPLLS